MQIEEAESEISVDDERLSDSEQSEHQDQVLLNDLKQELKGGYIDNIGKVHALDKEQQSTLPRLFTLRRDPARGRLLLGEAERPAQLPEEEGPTGGAEEELLPQ